MSKVLELFGESTTAEHGQGWQAVADGRWCPFLNRLCLKNRKSRPDVLIGTCTVAYGKENQPIVICPHRLLERRQIFTDCLHLLTLHEPGNEFHIISELSIPGGSVDYFLASANKGKVKDFVGIELQTLDTTGTVWPERQRFLREVGIEVDSEDIACEDTFGMNWKMTAKTILVQLHHKVDTFEYLKKHLVLVVQEPLIQYMRKNFAFNRLEGVRIGDSMHFHSYRVNETSRANWRLELASRFSTDVEGVSRLLGLQISPKVELEAILAQLEEKISPSTVFSLGPVTNVATSTKP